MTRTLAWLGTALWLSLLLGAAPALAGEAGSSPAPTPLEPTPLELTPGETTEPPEAASVTVIDPSQDPLSDADPESAADATPQPTPSPTPVPTAEPAEPTASDLPDDTDVLGGMLGVEEQGIPWGHFELGASVEFFDRLFSLQARLLFTIGRSLIAVALFVIDWVLRFDLGRVLAGVVGPLAETFDDGIVGPLQLRHFALLLAVGHAGWQFMRHRGQAAAAELAVAFAIAATGTFMVARAPVAGCEGLSMLGGLTQGVVSLAVVEDPATVAAPGDLCAEQAAEPDLPSDRGSSPIAAIKESIFLTFVQEPFLQLQWGQFANGDARCREVALEMLAAGAWGDHDHPREVMADAGCEDQAHFNAELSAGRVVGTVVYLLVAGAFAFAVIVAAGTLLLAQVAGALLVLAMPFALAAGIAPGTGREMLARWGHSILKVAVLFIGSAFFLMVLITGVKAIQDHTGDLPILQQMLTSCILAWGLVLLRGRIFSTLNFAARSGASRLAGPEALDAPGEASSVRGGDGKGGRRGSLAGRVAAHQAVKAAANASGAGRLAVRAAGVYARGRASRLSAAPNPVSSGGVAQVTGPVAPGTVPAPPRSLRLPAPPAHRLATARAKNLMKGAVTTAGRAAGGLAVAGAAATVHAAGSAVVRGVKASTHEAQGATVAVAGGPGVLRPSATGPAGSSSGDAASVSGPGSSTVAPASRRSLPDPSSLLDQPFSEGDAPEGVA